MEMFEDLGATFSPCRKWRYVLWRIWNSELAPVAFICLNPSTADETIDDPTVRRCVNYARRWGYGGLYVMNLFAFRATKPRVMEAAADPCGPDNDRYLREYAGKAHLRVAAWGTQGAFMGRDLCVLKLLSDMPVHSLGLTKNGFPRHPLYLKSDVKPEMVVRIAR